jgi:hypothetical protein
MIAYLLEEKYDREKEYQRRNIDERGLIGALTRFLRGGGIERRLSADVRFMAIVVFEHDAGGCFLEQILIGVRIHDSILLPPRSALALWFPVVKKTCQEQGSWCSSAPQVNLVRFPFRIQWS